MSSARFLTVIIPTHNPVPHRLERTLNALKSQTLTKGQWEVVVVDNGSSPALDIRMDDFPDARIIREDSLGLTYARVCGFGVAQGNLLVLVDDDNVLDAGYLQTALEISKTHPSVGVFGGTNIPEFEAPLPDWFPEPPVGLGIRDLGEIPLFGQAAEFQEKREYPPCAPVGAGMVLRREVAEIYSQKILSEESSITDRKGKALSSGGDCDLVMTVLEEGWDTGYFPELKLTHLIPAERLSFKYQCRLARGIMESWVQVLDIHGIRPWPAIPRWSVPLRQLKAWFTHRAWTGRSARLRWQAACGKLSGQSRLSNG